MTCPKTLHGGDLVCVNDKPHDPDAVGGHVYKSPSTLHLEVPA